MATVAAGLAHSIENLVLRLPNWRIANFRVRRAQEHEAPTALATLIESEVIPRLLVAHRSFAPALPDAERTLNVTDVQHFATLLIDLETAELVAHVDGLANEGVPIESLLIDLFAPAARILGQGWDEDRYDFVDVTMGMWRLQELVHEFAARQPPLKSHAPRRLRALFAAMPGDQHVFGVQVVGEVFRLAGWEVSSWTEGEESELLDAAGEQWLELLGLTVSREEDVDHAADLIAALRRRAQNPSLVVMAGGRVIAARPDLARSIGADATAPDARQAVLRAETLIATHTAPAVT